MKKISSGDEFRDIEAVLPVRWSLTRKAIKFVHFFIPRLYYRLMLTLIILPEKRLVYFRNPKAASTTITIALADAHQAYRARAWRLGLLRRQGYTVFTTVRDPLLRKESCYRWFQRTGQLPKGVQSWEDFKAYAAKHPWGNRHWMPQGMFVDQADRILAVSALEDDFKRLCDEFGLNVKFPLGREKQTL